MQYLQLLADAKIAAYVDSARYNGLEQVADAVDHLYSGKNVGKVIVHIGDGAKL
jgi:NADPH-dependent curcumin reductase CurA